MKKVPNVLYYVGVIIEMIIAEFYSRVIFNPNTQFYDINRKDMLNLIAYQRRKLTSVGVISDSRFDLSKPNKYVQPIYKKKNVRRMLLP